MTFEMQDKLILSFRIRTRPAGLPDFFRVSDLTREDYFSTIGFYKDRSWELNGRVVSGIGQASFFTQLDWVQDQCMKKLGFRPYPGTLNLNMEIFAESRFTVEELRKESAIQLVPPDPKFCAAKVLPVHIGTVLGAVIIPSKHVNVHEDSIVEVIAPLKLRDALGVKDGDVVTLVIDRLKFVDEEQSNDMRTKGNGKRGSANLL